MKTGMAQASPLSSRQTEGNMAVAGIGTEFVSMVAEEIVSGIDHAVEYWLGRIEQELTGASLTTLEQVHAIQRILREYKEVTGKSQIICASA